LSHLSLLFLDLLDHTTSKLLDRRVHRLFRNSVTILCPVSGLAPNFLETSLPAWNSYYQHEWQLEGIILPKNAKIDALQMRGLSMRHPVERSTAADTARAAKVGASTVDRILASVQCRPSGRYIIGTQEYGRAPSWVLWCAEAGERSGCPDSLIIRRRGRIPSVRGRACG
jgi:hypothetical protein